MSVYVNNETANVYNITCVTNPCELNAQIISDVINVSIDETNIECHEIDVIIDVVANIIFLDMDDYDTL